jgi:ribosomal RNA-processing protein 17
LQLREERKQELEAHVAAVNALLAEANDPGFLNEDDKSEEDEAWNGIEDEAPPIEHIDHEEEYIDEDKYTTVTVEEVDVTKEGLRYAGEDEEEELEAAKKKAEAAKKAAGEETNKKKVWPKKEKKQKFRYESKTERRLTRAKQKASNKGKANARRGEE